MALLPLRCSIAKRQGVSLRQFGMCQSSRGVRGRNEHLNHVHGVEIGNHRGVCDFWGEEEYQELGSVTMGSSDQPPNHSSSYSL